MIADKIRDELDDIAAELDGGDAPRSRRSMLNKRAHALKEMLRWCETRAGYVRDAADTRDAREKLSIEERSPCQAVKPDRRAVEAGR
jgi:hypothetical protein